MFSVRPFKYFQKPNAKIEDFFIFERFLLQIMGMWPWDSVDTKHSFWLFRFFGRLFELFMVLLPLHMIILQTKSVYDNWSEGLDRVTGLLVLILIYSFCLFSMCYFILNKDKLQRIVRLMNEHFQQRSAKGLTFVQVMDSYEKARKFAIAWTISCFLAVMLWAMYPILTRQRNLPIECWYPFDEKQAYVYEILYFVQILAQLQIGQVFGNGSGLYVMLIILLCGQYDLLFCSLKNLLHTGDFFTAVENQPLTNSQDCVDVENEELNQYYCSTEKLDNLYDPHKQHPIKDNSDEAIKEALNDCIRHHQGILSVCYAVEDFYNPFCLVKSLQMTVQLCFLVFVSVNTTSSVLKSLNLAQYLIMTLAELLIFTYLGEVLKIQSLRAVDAFSRCNWYLLDVKIRKDILIFLANSLRPVTITSAKFSGMDTQRLKSVITQAFSFFTLLQSLQ